MQSQVVLRNCRPVSQTAPAASETDSPRSGRIRRPIFAPGASDHASLPSLLPRAGGHAECNDDASLSPQPVCPHNPCPRTDAGLDLWDDASRLKPTLPQAASHRVDWPRSRLMTAGFHGRRRGSCVSYHFFPRSVGFGPTASCASGALTIVPSMLCQDQAIPSISSYSAKPRRHIFTKTPHRCHCRKYLCTELAAPYCLGRAFHWHPVRRTYTIPSKTLRGGIGFRPPPGRRLYFRPGILLGRGIKEAMRFHRISDTVHDLIAAMNNSIAISHFIAISICG